MLIPAEKMSAVLNCVADQASEPQVQLSIIAYALVGACFCCGVSKEAALNAVAAAFDNPPPMAQRGYGIEEVQTVGNA